MITCQICKKEYTDLGMPSHVSRIHKMNYGKDYKQKYNLLDYVNCEICGKKTLNAKFCSKRCANIYRSSLVKERKNHYSIDTKTQQYAEEYALLSEQLKSQICLDYQNQMSKNEISLKYNLYFGFVNKILEEKNVITNTEMHCLKLKEKYKTQYEELANSEIGLKICEEYQLNKENIRSLSRKYNLSRGVIARILVTKKINLKSLKNVMQEIKNTRKQKGIKPPRYGKSVARGGNVNWYFYKGVKYQGSWEFKYALFLESKNIQFLCHQGVKRFEYSDDKGTSKTYCPDFYLPDLNEYKEIKGMFTDEDKRKIEIIKKTYPDIKLEVIDKTKILELNILNIDKLLNVDIEDFLYNHDTDSLEIENILKRINLEDLKYDYIIKKLSLPKIAEKYNIRGDLISYFYNKYIPKRYSQEIKQLRLNDLISNIGQNVINDYVNNLYGFAEIHQKYKIKHGMIKLILSKFGVQQRANQTQRMIYQNTKGD